MALTNQETLEAVRAGLGRGDGRTDQDALIVRSINNALNDMAKDVTYPELKQYPLEISTTSGQNYLPLSDILTAAGAQSYDKVDQIFAMTLIDGSSYLNMLGSPERVFTKSFPINAATDDLDHPLYYTIIKDRLYFYPTPDADYTIQVLCSLWPTLIQASSGVITTGSDPGQASAKISIDKNDGGILAGAMYWAYMTLGNADKMRTFFPIFQKQIKDDKKKYGKKIDYYPSGDSWGYTNTMGTAPSADGSAGIAPYDGTIISTPLWDD